MRRKVLDAVRRFDAGAVLEGRTIRLSDGTTLPNERCALQWVVDTYQTRTRTQRQAAEADPDLAGALEVLEAAFGPVQVLGVRPNGPRRGSADG